ncbi:MAG: HEAT repeat domain-containing protein [Balneolaceae bacterium]
MNKIGSYKKELLHLSPKNWEEFLMKYSGLPGQRGNLELARAFAETATLMDFKKYVRLDPEEAPENTPEVFLVFCGVLGFGEYLAHYHDGGLLRQLRKRANDPRWRVREAVAMALQTIGRKNSKRLLKYARSWIEGSLLEQRAVIAGFCEPDILRDVEVKDHVFEFLDWATASMIAFDDKKDDAYEVLRKGLSYCWSVAAAEMPEKGKGKIERWIKEKHPVVNRIMRENLKKQRLRKVDPIWVDNMLDKLTA